MSENWLSLSAILLCYTLSKTNLFLKINIMEVYNRVVKFLFTPTNKISIQLLVIINSVFAYPMEGT